MMTSTLESALDRLSTVLRAWDNRTIAFVMFQIAVQIAITPPAHLMLHIAEGHWRVMFFGGHAVMAFGLLCTIAALVIGTPIRAGGGSKSASAASEDLARQIERASALATKKTWWFLAGLLLFLGGLGSFGLVYVRYGERMILGH